WPNTWTWQFVFMLRLGIETVSYQHFRDVIANSDDNRLIGRVVPQGLAPIDSWQFEKIVVRRRRWHCPLQAARRPRIRTCELSCGLALKEIDNEDEKPCGHENHAEAGQQVQTVPVHFRLIGVNAARHATQTKEMHGEKCQIESDEEKPEMQLAEQVI